MNIDEFLSLQESLPDQIYGPNKDPYGSLKKVKHDNWDVFVLKDVKQNYEVVELLEQRLWIGILEQDGKLDFILVEFLGGHCDASDEDFVSPIFYGYGFSNQRECRHMYWFPFAQGYSFYPDAQHITLGLEYLKKYFDMD